jgi:hypothetical protein
MRLDSNKASAQTDRREILFVLDRSSSFISAHDSDLGAGFMSEYSREFAAPKRGVQPAHFSHQGFSVLDEKRPGPHAVRASFESHRH